MIGHEISHNEKNIIIIITLIVLVLVAYWPVQDYEFVDYDDQTYVTNNYRIQSGFTFKSITETFTDIHTGHWHPLTMISHMLDWQLFGDKAGGHHWNSVIIHFLNTILLFLLFRTLTGAIWRSAFVAALFAIHPINVESVAWIAERKNVLSTFFWLLTMFFYVWYVKSPNWKRYLPVFFCFALGLMSKPILVTLPFVLLLIDYWPLRRTMIEQQNENQTVKSESILVEKTKLPFLILEKIPLFILSAISICLTLYAQHTEKAMAELNSLPLLNRVSNALVSYVLYIKKLFWPMDLAVFYPYLDLPIWQISIAALLLVIITIFAVKYVRIYPYLTVGWFWYLGTLVPVIGLIQAGSQSMADRYAYIPFIGLFIIIVWSMAEIMRKGFLIKLSTISSGVILVILLMTTHSQVKYWNNTFVLFEHAVNVTDANFIAHTGLGIEFLKQNRINEAIAHFNTAITLNPKYYMAFIGLGEALNLQGKKNEAIIAFQHALQLKPKSDSAHNSLGAVFFQIGRLDEAIEEFQNAIALNSDNFVYHNNLGNALIKKGKSEEAIKEYSEVVRIQPRHAGLQNNLALLLMDQGRVDEAIKHFQEAIRLQPENAKAHFYLAKILKQKGLAEAEYHLKEAIRINPEYKNIDKLQSRNNIGK